MQGCGPTVPDHPSESYPGARMDGHSGSENDDSADQGDKIPELCDTSDDDCDELFLVSCNRIVPTLIFYVLKSDCHLTSFRLVA